MLYLLVFFLLIFLFYRKTEKDIDYFYFLLFSFFSIFITFFENFFYIIEYGTLYNPLELLMFIFIFCTTLIIPFPEIVKSGHDR